LHRLNTHPHKSSQDKVLAAVKQGVTAYGTKKITIIGHSMGAALSTIAAASMKLRLGSDYTFKVVGYGMPRVSQSVPPEGSRSLLQVGNPAWVDWVNSNIPDLTRINHKVSI
jgi:pimeloyl-ACP methyl ester carboxylesterase